MVHMPTLLGDTGIGEGGEMTEFELQLYQELYALLERLTRSLEALVFELQLQREEREQ